VRGSRIDINNWRSREWTPALKAAGIEHRRIYDMRHTFARWNVAAA
jgi:integrase